MLRSNGDLPREEIIPQDGVDLIVDLIDEEEPFADGEVRIDDLDIDGEGYFTQVG